LLNAFLSPFNLPKLWNKRTISHFEGKDTPSHGIGTTTVAPSLSLIFGPLEEEEEDWK